jgi:uncharacterized membrane protein YfcA
VAVDEQQLVGLLVIAAFLAFLAASLAARNRRRSASPQLVFVLVLLGSKAALWALEGRFPVPNYPEEFKEWLFSLGFLCYSLDLLRHTRASRRPSARPVEMV